MNALVRDPDADCLHAEALQAALNGRFDDAYDAFHEAYDALMSDQPTIAVAVQAARVLRDEGFTHVRLALAEREREPLDEAAKTMDLARNLTEPLATCEPPFRVGPELRTASQRAALQEIHAEHGATLGCLGRLVTVRNTVFDSDARRAASGSEQEYYADAYYHAVRGNNAYYRTSIAMTAARQEALHSRPDETKRWMARAAFSVARSVVWCDPGNAKGAAATAARRWSDVRSYEDAKRSVFVRP